MGNFEARTGTQGKNLILVRCVRFSKSFKSKIITDDKKRDVHVVMVVS
jgi:hypothetical protein